MKEQLALALADPPRRPRRAAMCSYFPAAAETLPEALSGEERASGAQDARVLAVFEAHRGQKLTPWEVLAHLADQMLGDHPLITSVRRSITTLTYRGTLVHHPRERRMGPAGARCSTWSLA